MNKTFVHTFLSFIVAFSLLAPAVVPLIKANDDTFVLIDFSEEESKKETKKEIEEKQVYFHDLGGLNSSSSTKDQTLNYAYFIVWHEGSSEIFLPPPERNS
ncbi:MAG: hypothetical protein HKN48_04145 [Flavobacteriaceae bacterium]|nr:hypothetical protein [Flavobacteriaceae bacterium]